MSDPAVLEIVDSDAEEVEMHGADAFAVELARQLRGEEQDDTARPPASDPERLPRETEPYPPLPDPATTQCSGDRAKAAAQLRHQSEKEAAAALASGDVQRAVDAYTLAMRTSGATAMMLSNRAALLLKQRRPCAAIRDCTAALKINSSMVKAYRIRGIAHRKLGHWRKAHSDLSEAQVLKFDEATVDMHRFLAAKCARLDAVAEKQQVTEVGDQAQMDSGSIATAQTVEAHGTPLAGAEMLRDLDKGQAIVLCGLQKTPQLNGKRGVVERSDPRPASKGRWEVEVRLDGGRLEIKSLKRENIMTLNKADRAACRRWANEEKQHKEERKLREEREDNEKMQKCVEATMGKLPINETTQQLLRNLRPQDALGILDKVCGSHVVDANGFITTEVNLLMGESDSDDEPAAKRNRP